MDLKKFEMSEWEILHWRDAAGELMYADGADGKPDPAKPIRAHLYGPGSSQYAEAQLVQLGHALERMAKGEQAGSQTAQEKAEFLAKVTRELENVTSATGAVGQALYLEVYANPKLSFLVPQSTEFAGKHANFFRRSPTS